MRNTPEQAAEASTRRRPAWILIALVVVLTLVAVWLVPEDREAPPPTPEPAATVEAPPVDAPPVEAPVTTAPSTSTPAETTPTAEGDWARAYVTEQRARAAPDLPGAYSEAERLRAEGRLTDAWLIHFYAARQGHAPSALVLGTLSDPSYHEAGMGALDEPDPAQALKWYKMAAQAGDGEAARRLQNLRTRLEEAAAGGDPEAERLLLQWR